MTGQLSRTTASPSQSVSFDLYSQNANDVRGYQVAIAIARTSGSGSVSVVCPNGASVNASRVDYLFLGLSTFNLTPTCSNCGVIATSCSNRRVAAARANGTVSPGSAQKYLATFTLRVSSDAGPGSTFAVSISPFPGTIVADSGNDSIPLILGPSRTLTVVEGASIPTITGWGAVALFLLLLIAGTLCLQRTWSLGSLAFSGQGAVTFRSGPSRGNTRGRPLPGFLIVPAMVLTSSATYPEAPTEPLGASAAVCITNADCDDGAVCTFDQCSAGTCTHMDGAHGDVANAAGCGPDGVVDSYDVAAMRNAFAGTFSSGCVRQNLDIWSNNACVPDGVIDLFDLLGVLKTLAGHSKCGCDEVADSVEQEPPAGLEPGAPGTCGACDEREGDVYPFSGEFHVCVTDLRIKGRGIDFVWARKYRSKIGPNTAQGNGWDFSYNIRVQRSGPNLILHNGNSRRDLYLLQPNGTWTRRELFRVIEQNPDATYTVDFPDRGRWDLKALDGSAAQGKLQRLVDRNGNTLTFDYDGLGRLIRVHDTLDTVAHNRDITIAYTASGLIASVTDFVGRTVLYQYYGAAEPGGSLGDLKSVRTPIVVNTVEFPIPTGHEFPAGKTTVYTYSKGFADRRLNHNLLTITDPKGQTCVTNQYHVTDDPHLLDFDRVQRRTWGGPTDIIDLVYVDQIPSSGNNFASRKVISNDRVGNVKEHFFESRNRAVMLREFTGRANPVLPTSETTNRPTGQLRAGDPPYFETRVEYNGDSLRTRTVYPNGNEEQRTYDATNFQRRSQGNLLQVCRLSGPLGGDQPQICETFEYDDGFGGCCGTNFVTRHVDGRNNETLYTYDAQGNRLSAQERIPTIVEDFEYNAFGQLSAHILPDNGSGHRQRNEMTYYTTGPQYGYLAQEVLDATVLALARTYEYNAVGQRVREVDPRGNDSLFIYNQLDQLLRERSREVTTGTGVRYDREAFYDANDNVVRIDEPNVNDQGMVQSNTHFSTLFEFDCLNNPIRTCQEIGHVALGPFDRGCATPQPGDFIINDYEYDASRNLSLIRQGEAVNGNQGSNTARLLHDERDLLFQEIQAQGTPGQSTTQYDYDGNRNRKALREGIESAPRVTTYVLDGYDRTVATTDPMGNVRTDSYDANGNHVQERTDGELVDVVGGGGNVRLAETDYTYDAMDRLIQADVGFFDPATQVPIGDGLATTTTEYNGTSKVRRVTDDNGQATETSYDTANRQQTVTDAKGNARTFTYDANSNLISETDVDKSDLGNADQVFTTTQANDNLDRLTQRIDNAGNMHRFFYDSRNNRTRSIDALGRETRFEFDGVDRLAVTTRDGDGDGADGNGLDIVTTQIWDDSLRLVAQIDGNGNATQYAYDALDRLIVTQMADGTIHQVGTGATWPLGDPDPDLSLFLSGYDVHDNRVRTRDANGTIVDAVYDLLDRVTSRSITLGPGIGGTTSESYSYDGVSRMVRAEDNDSRVTRAYDSVNHMTRETLVIDPAGGQWTGATIATYDGTGNRLSTTYPGGRALTSTYDELDRVRTIADGGGTIATYSYVGAERVERREYPAARSDYSYDGITGVPNPPGDFGVRSVIRTMHSRIIGGQILDDRTYLWNRMENNTQRRDERAGGPLLTHAYTYDAFDRMTRALVSNPTPTTVRDTNYAMDLVGNRTSVVGPPNPGPYLMDAAFPAPADLYVNQYTTTSFDARLYDDNGNLTREFLGQPGERAVLYDYRNQTVQLTVSGVVHQYAYDALGRRIQRILDATGTPQTTRYYSFGKQELEERNAAGATVATYVYGISIDEVLNMQRGGSSYYYLGDDLHNVMAVIDAAGTVVERYEYQDYGQPEFFTGAGTPIAASAIGNPLLFTGRRYDPESGWYYFRSRYLDPLAGRFTTRDPIGIWGDEKSVGNGYAYAGNNPWSAVDPEGHGWFKKLKKKIKEVFKPAADAVRKIVKGVARVYQGVARVVKFVIFLPNYIALTQVFRGILPKTRLNYGNHCGLFRYGDLPPKDRVDACCQTHDQCGRWSLLTLGTVGGRRCNETFCRCLKDAPCLGNDDCRRFRMDAKRLFCGWP